MATSYEKYQKRKLISSYFSVIISIFLVLGLLGVLSLFVIHSQKISDNFRETIPMTLFFNGKTSEKELTAFGEKLKQAPYIKDFTFVSKEEAAKNQEEALGENFLEFLGFNPLQDSYDIHLNSDYVVSDSIAKIEAQFASNPNISDIMYDKQLVEMVNDNIQKITQWLLITAGVLTLISMLLINSSLRLLIYSSRFTIKTMQMVGATKRFIRRPFIWHSMRLGIIGSLLAIAAIIGLSFYVDQKFPDLDINPTQNYMPIVFVSLGLFLVGIIITSISTYFATQRFLNLKSDELY
ncbi:cell division protein FtsX [Myroides indicus]|uniref:Cell division protein FtsX n=1 Tax=Myroides indicus TaxID=1323422 RepID=A0A4R7F992_9FLAO|nr:permease-like cell division protein FtsX [Myroides indicus]TDS63609.1 cell division protein FtsX [Myroides indicus]